MSAAYYAVFHDLTDRAARHLIGSSPDSARNRLRRSWSHGEFAAAAELVVGRAKALAVNASTPLTLEMAKGGPLVDIAAGDADLAIALRLFSDSRRSGTRPITTTALATRR